MSECGITHGILAYPSWSRFGLNLRLHEEDAFSCSIMDSIGRKSTEMQSHDLLVFFFHYQSTEPIQFTSLKKGAIQQSGTIDTLVRKVSIFFHLF